MFNKILIANRGEIAVRIINAARAAGIKSVAIYSEADQDALHVRKADEAYQTGSGNELKDTYLNVDEIIRIAKESGADAIHPGYGFLSENPELVAACEKAGIVFIGPHTRAIQLMGNKIESREFVKKLGIPMTEAVTGSHEELLKAAETIPFPLLVKAAAGGGGKGMRIVRSKEELEEAIESTAREAGNYFGDPAVFVEKYVENPRHIEIQVMGDNHGNAVHLFERECSIQRRHQKIIEESPSATLTPEVRHKMGEAAVKIAKAVGYNSAGTVEFLVDKDLNFYFLEMNTRIQVEHPVTEEVTGIDLVKEQISVAAGNELSFGQEDIRQTGHAIECRVYAEDPANNFLPSPGYITRIFNAVPEDTRMDMAYEKPGKVESFYDPMLGKIIVHGKDRQEAIAKMDKALRNYAITGINTNLAYLIQIINSQAFRDNQISTDFCNLHTGDLLQKIEEEKSAVSKEMLAATYLALTFEKQRLKRKAKEETGEKLSVWEKTGFWRDIPVVTVRVEEEEYPVEIKKQEQGDYVFNINGKDFSVSGFSLENGEYISLLLNGKPLKMFYYSGEEGDMLIYRGHMFRVERKDYLKENDFFVSSAQAGGNTDIVPPMPGKVIKINVAEGQEVKKGEVLLIVEAMKMENNIIAPADGTIRKINVAAGDMVEGNTRLVEMDYADQ